MARSEDISIPAKVWTEITNGDVATITFQNKSSSQTIQVTATAGLIEPTGVDGTAYAPGAGEYDLNLATAFPGVSGANRVWVYTTRASGFVTVFVSHA